MEKVYVYGTGSYCQEIYDKLKSNYEILGFIEDAQYIKNSTFKDLPLLALEEAIKKPFDKIIIATQYIQTYDNLIALSVSKNKILLTPPIYFNLLETANLKINNEVKLVPEFIDWFMPTLMLPMQYDFIKKPHFITKNEHFDFKRTMKIADYMRYRTIELLKEQIDLYNIEGEVAELGVFRGDLALELNKLFSNRKLYLFDTFEGFNELEKLADQNKGYTPDFDFDAFKNTSIDFVLERMKYKENCIIKQGYFPDSLDGLEEKFAFVSIDVDLYDPIYNGLCYFYPRLSKGGYIIIHDYNMKTLFGVKQAILDYEKQFGKLMKVPISDFGGTLIITKPYS